MTLGALAALVCIAVAAILGVTEAKFVWPPGIWIFCAIVFAILGGPVLFGRKQP